jgi:hypothetical protein
MTPVEATFVSLDGADLHMADHVRVGDRLFVMAGLRLFAIDLAAAAVMWVRTWSRPDPTFYRVPRRPHAHGRRLWTKGDALVSVVETEHGVAAVCRDVNTGDERWRREIRTPPPLAWTEAEPAWPGAPTEEIDAFVLAEDSLVLALARTTRRSMQWPDKPAPPFHAQLDVFGLEPTDGAIRSIAHIPDAWVPILEKRRLARWLVAGRRLLELDCTTGSVRTVSEFPAEPCWPRERAGKVTLAWRERGYIAAATVDRVSGHLDIEHRWKRKKVSEIAVHPLADAAALQINDQFFAMLEANLTPKWEARVRPYIYGAVSREGGPVFVAASGGGGGLSVFDREDGTPLVEARLSGGAWDVTVVSGTEQIAAACGEGLVTARVRGRVCEPKVTPIQGVRTLIEAGPGRIALLCGDPTPGIHVVDIE